MEIQSVTIKDDSGHHEYLRILSRMSPGQRLELAFELTGISRELFLRGLRKRFPEKSDEEIHKIFLERIEECYNANYKVKSLRRLRAPT